MVVELLLLQLLWLLPSSAQNITCQDRCGDVPVPYPFGIGAGCYKEDGFAIKCDNSYNPPKAFLNINPTEVLNISLDGEIRIINKMYSECYNNSGIMVNNTPVTVDYTGTPYTFSPTRNSMMAIGCNTIAALIKDPIGNSTVGSCVSGYCNISFSQSCSGSRDLSCCSTSIPGGLKRFDVELYNLNKAQQFTPFSSCSYAFLRDRRYNLAAADGGAPVVLDWAIGAGGVACEEASRNSATYACGPNSDCRTYNGSGYNCICSKGYEGNPYRPAGCQDINECASPNSNPCSPSICTNMLGGYSCSCPPPMVFVNGSFGNSSFQMTCVDPRPSTIDKRFFALGGLGIGIALLLLVFGGIWLYQRLMKRKQIKLKEKFFKQNGGLLLQQKIHSRDGSIEQTKIFAAEELDKATDNYNKNRILGQGASGTVYKGMLPDGKIIAVKKSKTVVEGQIGQFINEVAILSQINHRNVVKLMGCCLETKVPLLVYEFISNGTLFQHIHELGYKSSMSWDKRLRIATEVAGALAYMHSMASTPIFHRDIKSSNILLDNICIAKVADFGISRSLSGDQTHLTTAVQGTFGYLDPEYYYTGQFTDKSDVYSFGIVLAELLIGEKAISMERSEESRSLAVYFISSMKENRLFQILEDRVVKEGEKEQILAVAEVAKACLQQNGKNRPTMKEVAIELEGLRSHRHPWVQENQEEVDLFVRDPSYLYSGSLIEQDTMGGYSSTFEIRM